MTDLAQIPALPPVAQLLQELGVAHRVFRHPGPIHSLEQAAAERGQRPQQVVRSILFRVSAGEFVMGLIAGPAQISWAKLRRHLGQSRLTMASEEEVLQITGYVTGTVSPLGLPRPLPVLIDPSALAEAEISIGSGERGMTVILASQDLLRLLPRAQVVSLCEGC